MIRFESVTRRFGTTTAVDNLSCEFSASATHILIGASGCGKTTMLRLVLGLIGADDGYITLSGERIDSHARNTMTKHFGYIVQEGGLFPHLTAGQNVSLAAEARSWSAKQIEARISELLGVVKLQAEIMSKYPFEMSGGQRQRVSLMRALLLDPPVLLLDEPLGALDPMVRDALQQELKGIFSTLKKTVLIVTHDIREAAILGDTITLLSGGKIVQQGSFEDLALRPATPFVTDFIKAQELPQHLAGYF